MAEFAELNIQATVAEVEELERLGLLNKKEIKALIEKRREFEYRLSRRSKNKVDFINSINYEKKFLELLLIRRRNMKMLEKTKEIEGAVKTRIMKRCRLMTRYWPHHHDTWALRINFAKEIGWKPEVSITYAEQVRYLGQHERIYISWAKYEIEERSNFDMARKVLLSKASLYHSNSIAIKRELFRLELLFVESLKKSKGKEITEVIAENREKVLSCGIPRAVYLDAVKTIPDQQMYLELYQVADKFRFAHELRDEIYRDMLKTCTDSAYVWQLRAQRNALGLDDAEDAPKKLLGVDKLASIIKTYDEALEVIGPSFLSTYVEDLLLMLHEVWGHNIMNTITKKLLNLFSEYQSSLLLEHYIIWFHLIKRDPKPGMSLQSLLETSLKVYPDAAPLQLEFLRNLLEGNDKLKMQKVKKITDNAKGPLGIQMWKEIIKRMKTTEEKVATYTDACNSRDDVVAKAMRIKCLKWLIKTKIMKKCRLFYKTYGMIPPLSPGLHATMIMGELTKKRGDVAKARKVFENAALHCGKTEPGFWLAYIYFEKHAGDPLKAGALFTRAERELGPREAEIFRQLQSMAVEILSKPEKDFEERKFDKVWVTGKDTKVERIEKKKAIVQLFLEEHMLTYSQDIDRKAFYSGINHMRNMLKTECSVETDDVSEWEGVLQHLVKQKVPLTIQEVTLNKETKQEEVSLLAEKREKQKRYSLSDTLDPGTAVHDSKATKSDLSSILEKSMTLKSNFMQLTHLAPYHMNKKKAKTLRKRENSKTKGPGWFDMKKPEMTEEVKRDLEILQMRSVIDPKRPFKDRDMKVLPKYFQMGKIMDSPADFYASRIPKKKRKRTMAEEIMHDEEAIRFQKRKYTEIIAKKQQMKQTQHSKAKKIKVKNAPS